MMNLNKPLFAPPNTRGDGGCAAAPESLTQQLAGRAGSARQFHGEIAGQLSQAYTSATHILSVLLGQDYASRVAKEYVSEQGPSEPPAEFRDHSLIDAVFSTLDIHTQGLRVQAREVHALNFLLGQIISGLNG